MSLPDPATLGCEHVRWQLDDLFQDMDHPAVEELLAWAKTEADSFKRAYSGQVAQLADEALASALKRYETLLAAVYKLGQYSSLRYALDTSDDRIKAFEQKIREANIRLENELVGFDLELGKIPPDRLETLLRAECLAPYAYFLRRKTAVARYHLSEPEETLINLKNLTGASAFRNLYEEFTTAFRFELKLDGERRTLTGEELRALRQHPRPAVRREAMRRFLGRHQDEHLVLTTVFNAVLKDYNLERQRRGFASPISVMNTYNDLDDALVDTLHTVTTASYPLVQRYYRLKAKLLRLPDLTLADIYAPLPEAEKTYSWEQAKSLVLQAFRGFDEDFCQLAESLFQERHVDAPAVPNKRGGAFCSSSAPDVKPFVLVNFLGRLRDVSTLAHELGHAIHSLLSRNQPLVSYHAILPMAETASVFGEMILADHLLSQEQDPLVRQSLLTSRIEETFATSHRQNMFSRFERAAHAAVSERRLSPEEWCALFRRELELMFGQAVRIPEEFSWEWAAIPHLVEMPFYVYAYNFANLLVMGLYGQYKEQGEKFVPAFKRLLAAGSSDSPVKLAAMAGVDLENPDFWQKGLNLISQWIDEVEQLANRQTKRMETKGIRSK
ncbi:MAG: M3 family oligoendopeptidase [candidate division FCPU426 bacterium]